MDGSKRLVSIIDLAKALGVSVATVNYYTNLGFFKINERKGNRRLYNLKETVNIFERIQQLRKEGYSLRLIQQKLEKGYNV